MAARASGGLSKALKPASICAAPPSARMASAEPKDKERVREHDATDAAHAPATPDVRIVRLNIGGYKYATTRATLLTIPNSYFAALLDERVPTAKDEKGAYFIDRDGQYFPPILTYLRTKELHVPLQDRRAVLREAKFYLLTPVVQLLQGVCAQDDEIQQSRWHAHAQKVRHGRTFAVSIAL